jgi:holo-[acyl-carrier protein] synthase
MIFGIGTDIVSYSRIYALNERYGVRFAQRVLHPAEMIGYAASPDSARYLMKRFAAKEAFSKALGTGLRAPVAMSRIRIEHDEWGKPLLAFDEILSAYMERAGVARWYLSISDERDAAVAFVVLEKE